MSEKVSPPSVRKSTKDARKKASKLQPPFKVYITKTGEDIRDYLKKDPLVTLEESTPELKSKD